MNTIKDITLGTLFLIVVLGCEVAEGPGGSEMDALAAQLDQPPASTTPASERPMSVETAPDAPVNEGPQVVTAKTPKRGKTLHDQGSYLSAVGSARFRAEHQMIFNNVKHALQLYQAEHGEYPKSHEDFMTKIIEPNSIVLPELEEGYEYWYDPDEPLDLKYRPIADAEIPAE